MKNDGNDFHIQTFLRVQDGIYKPFVFKYAELSRELAIWNHELQMALDAFEFRIFSDEKRMTMKSITGFKEIHSPLLNLPVSPKLFTAFRDEKGDFSCIGSGLNPVLELNGNLFGDHKNQLSGNDYQRLSRLLKPMFNTFDTSTFCLYASVSSPFAHLLFRTMDGELLSTLMYAIVLPEDLRNEESIKKRFYTRKYRSGVELFNRSHWSRPEEIPVERF